MRTRAPTGTLLATAFTFGCGAPVPDGLGPGDGRLSPCPSTPNCVNTGDRHPDGTEPIFLRDTSDATWSAVVDVVLSMPRTTELDRGDRYLHVEQRTRLLRFADDLELLLRPDNELLVRSASRVGQGDLGANARRVQDLRDRLNEAGLLADG